MTRKTVKRGIRKYTAFVPKTMRATTNLRKKVIHGATSVLNGAVHVVRQSANAADKAAARAIRSFTQGKKQKTQKTQKTQKKRSHTHKKNHKRQ